MYTLTNDRTSNKGAPAAKKNSIGRDRYSMTGCTPII